MDSWIYTFQLHEYTSCSQLSKAILRRRVMTSQNLFKKNCKGTQVFRSYCKKEIPVMRKSRILSNFRIEYRKNLAAYQKEISALRWIRKFLEELSIDDSSQIREWQIDFFLSELKKGDYSYNDFLQAKSALHILMDRVLSRNRSSELPSDSDAPGVFKITA